jgi:hypothetical protein
MSAPQLGYNDNESHHNLSQCYPLKVIACVILGSMEECQNHPLKATESGDSGDDDTGVNVAPDDTIANRQENDSHVIAEKEENTDSNAHQQKTSDLLNDDLKRNAHDGDTDLSVSDLPTKNTVDDNESGNVQVETVEKRGTIKNGGTRKSGKGENDQMKKKQQERNHGQEKLEDDSVDPIVETARDEGDPGSGTSTKVRKTYMSIHHAFLYLSLDKKIQSRART